MDEKKEESTMPPFPKQQVAVEPQRRPRVLLAVSGSVAAVKVPELAVQLREVCSAHVRVVVTEAAWHFFSNCAPKYAPKAWAQFKASDPPFEVLRDKDEWQFDQVGDPVLHINLRGWADVLLVAPASANTIAKLSHGLCDNLLSCVARAWDFQKPVILCPAMNTFMWTHPATAEQLQVLKRWGYVVLEPVVKVLACKDRGKGALPPVGDIVDAVKEAVR